MSFERRLLCALAVLGLTVAAGCGAGEPAESGRTAGGEEVSVDGRDALVWGEGAYGVVLAHGNAFDAASWRPQAERMAEQGMVVIAVEDIAPDSILDAAAYLQGERGADAVAMIGGSAGADAILHAAAQRPDAPDQLILLSPNRAVDGLGPQPKLLVASEDEAVADVSRQLAANSPGAHNEALILPGDAHAQNIFDSDQGERLTEAILERLSRFSGA